MNRTQRAAAVWTVLFLLTAFWIVIAMLGVYFIGAWE